MLKYLKVAVAAYFTVGGILALLLMALAFASMMRGT